MRRLFILSFFLFSLCCEEAMAQPDVEQRIEETIAQMTLHEKLQLLHAQGKFSSAGVQRLGIRELHHSDGPHGVRAEVDWNTWGTANWTNDSIVAFPSLTCLAATWNRDLSSLYGHAIGEEFAFRDKHIMLGPGVNIARMPLCGRNFEYMGEDPYLAGVMVVPYIREVQKLGVACCLKHFFLNNQEINRFGVNVHVSERALNEIYLPAFRSAVQQGGVWTVMGAYNKWLGTWCCENDSLLNGILKRQWGFDGAVVSDWGGVHSTLGAAFGGMDIEMGTNTDGKTIDRSHGFNSYYLADAFESLVRKGEISEKVLDDKVRRVLRTIFRTSMNPNRAIGKQCSPDHYEACLRIAEEGIVLMKNDKHLLPLDGNRYRHILVVGENATRSLTEGGGSSELKTKYGISPLDAIRDAFPNAKVDYAQGYYSGRPLYGKAQERLDESRQRALREEALTKATEAEVVIFVGGLNKNGFQDCEDSDRKEFALSFGQPELIKALATRNKNLVVVTFGGNPFDTSWSSSVPSFLHCWYLGSMSGRAIANLLTGETNPSGRLPITFARRLEDYPCFKGGERTYPGVDGEVYYDEDIFVGYRYFDTFGVASAFPFGHGLSYTTFAYGKPSVRVTEDAIDVDVPVTNTGKCDGKEVVQLYVGVAKEKSRDFAHARPLRELKAFDKVALKAGETKTVTLTLPKHALQVFSPDSHRWEMRQGKVRIYIGTQHIDVML